jgi:hypothetical protein
VLRRLWARKKNEGICYEEWQNRAHDGLETDKSRFEGLRIIKIDTTDSRTQAILPITYPWTKQLT